jgi:hypothetical protein
VIAEIVRGPGFSKPAGVESVALAVDAAWYMEGDPGCVKFRTYDTVGKSVVLLTRSSTLFI